MECLWRDLAKRRHLAQARVYCIMHIHGPLLLGLQVAVGVDVQVGIQRIGGRFGQVQDRGGDRADLHPTDGIGVDAAADIGHVGWRGGEPSQIKMDASQERFAASGFGGYRESGFGREGGREGLWEYVKAEGRRGGEAGPRRLAPRARPPCPLCDEPLDPEGHLCVRTNGYRRAPLFGAADDAEDDPET